MENRIRRTLPAADHRIIPGHQRRPAGSVALPPFDPPRELWPLPSRALWRVMPHMSAPTGRCWPASRVGRGGPHRGRHHPPRHQGGHRRPAAHRGSRRPTADGAARRRPRRGEGVLAWGRRRGLARVAMAIETDLRNDLYAHLQRLDVGFHERMAVGPVAVVCDERHQRLSGKFTGFGAVFFLINVFTFVAGRRGSMVRLHVRTRAGGRRSSPSRWWVTLSPVRALRLLRWCLVRIQDQSGRHDATLVEEVGHRHPGLSRRSAGATRWSDASASGQLPRCDEHVDGSAVVSARASSGRDLARRPNIEIGRRLSTPAALAVAVRASTMVGDEVVALIAYLLDARPGRSEGRCRTPVAMEEAKGATTRVEGGILQGAGRAPHRRSPGARALASVRGRASSLRLSGFTYGQRTDPVLLRAWTSDRAGRDDGAGRRDRLGQDDAHLAGPRLYDVSDGRVSPSTASTSGTSICRQLRAHVARVRGATLFSASVRENLPLGTPGATDADVERRSRSRRRSSCTTCRGAWTPGSASRACRCPVASDSGWPWPAR